MASVNPHPGGIEVAVEDLFWLTRGRHWDFELLLGPEDIPLPAGRAILERLQTEGLGRELPGPPVIWGDLEASGGRVGFVASAWLEADPELHDSAGRPIHHSLVWFRRTARDQQRFVQDIPEDWQLQILEGLKPAFRKVFDLPEELVRGWRDERKARSFGQHLKELLAEAGCRPGMKILLARGSRSAASRADWIAVGTLEVDAGPAPAEQAGRPGRLDFSWQPRRWDWKAPPARLIRAVESEVRDILRRRLRELQGLRASFKRLLENPRRAMGVHVLGLLVDELPVLFDGRKGDRFLEEVGQQAQGMNPLETVGQGLASLPHRPDFFGKPNAGREALAHLLAEDVSARHWLKELPEPDGLRLVAALLAHGADPEDRCVEAVYLRAVHLAGHRPQ